MGLSSCQVYALYTCHTSFEKVITIKSVNTAVTADGCREHNGEDSMGDGGHLSASKSHLITSSSWGQSTSQGILLCNGHFQIAHTKNAFYSCEGKKQWRNFLRQIV
jgi:hypothetical protein